MLKKFSSLMLVGLMLQAAFIRPAAAQAKANGSMQAVEKVKAAVAKIGTGLEAQAEVRLYNNTKVKGYISEAKEDNFTIVDNSTGAPTTLAYSQVKQVKRNRGGSDLSFDAQPLIIVAVGLAAALGLYAISCRGRRC